MPFGYGAWLWFKDNRWAQIVLGLGIAYLIMRGKEEFDKRRGREQERIMWERRRAEERERAVQYIETRTEEAADAADQALENRDRALRNPEPRHHSELSDAAFERRFGYRRTDREVDYPVDG